MKISVLGFSYSKKVRTILSIYSVLFLLGGCASGAIYNEAMVSFPSLAASEGRIMLYRNTMMGAAVQPSVRINGEIVGKAKPKGFFYVDLPAPGTYTISTQTEAVKMTKISIEPGQTKYVRLEMQMGVMVGRINPVEVANAIGSSEISKMKYAP